MLKPSIYAHPSYHNRHNSAPLEFIGAGTRRLADHIYLMMMEARQTNNAQLLRWARKLEEEMYASPRPLIMLD